MRWLTDKIPHIWEKYFHSFLKWSIQCNDTNFHRKKCKDQLVIKCVISYYFRYFIIQLPALPSILCILTRLYAFNSHCLPLSTLFLISLWEYNLCKINFVLSQISNVWYFCVIKYFRVCCVPNCIFWTPTRFLKLSFYLFTLGK